MWAAKWYLDVTSAVVLILVSLKKKKTTILSGMNGMQPSGGQFPKLNMTDNR